jgi:arylsulfatase
MVSDTGGAKQWQLFDLEADPGERSNVADAHSSVVDELDARYDQWWTSIPPHLVNENAVGPKYNSFAELYWKEYGGGPADR